MTCIEVPFYTLYMARTFFTIIYMLHSTSSKGQTYTFISSGYIGCFDGQKQKHPYKLDDWNNNTGNLCKLRCQTEGYIFAGTKNGNQCFCGNHTYSYTKVNNGCVEKCPGNNCEICGGSDRLSLFDTRVKDSCRTAKCRKDEICKDNKKGFLCISINDSQNLGCSYNGSTFVDNNDMRQYFIYNRNLSYWKAQENCKILKAAIVSYTNPVQYILLQRNITIHGAYWVGGGVEHQDDKCLVLDTRGSTSLYSKPCTKPLYSICSRVANISDILNQPEFVEMIKNMTVNSRKTTKMKRKLNCSHDNRASAKAIGAIIGAGAISVICCLLF